MSLRVRDKTTRDLHEIAGMFTVDSFLSSSSTNPVMNKEVYFALRPKVEATTTALVNYYLKSDTYSKNEVDAIVAAIATLTIKVVAALPTTDISTTTLYFVGPITGTTTYSQYVRVNNAWVALGNTDIDLNGYVSTSDLELAIADFLTETEISALLDEKQNKALSASKTIGTKTASSVEGAIDIVSDIVPSTATTTNKLVVKSELDLKQNKIFTGQSAEWAALSSTDKAKYDIVILTDD